MSRKTQLAFIGFFLFIVFGVGIVQAVIELRRKEPVQGAYFLLDTFIAPYKRTNDLHTIFGRFSRSLDSLRAELGKGIAVAEQAQAVAVSGDSLTPVDPWEATEAVMLAEEVSFIPLEIKKRADSVNTYYSLEESDPLMARLDSMYRRLEYVYKAASNRGDIFQVKAVIDSVTAQLPDLAAMFPRVTPLNIPSLAVKAFFTSTFFSARYLRGYEKAMEDGSVVAKTTRRWMQFVRYALLHDVGEKALYGREGWLFYRPDVEYLTRPYILDKRSQVVDYNDKAAENAVQTIVNFRDQLKQRGVELLVVVVPGKPSIYPDLLVAGMQPEQAGTFSHSRRTIKELQEKGVECVDLFDPFAKERLRDKEAGDSVYLWTDTHWKARGLRLASKLVAERVRQYPWFSEGNTEFVIDSVVVNRKGDIGVMTQLPNLRVRELGLEFALEPTKCYQVYMVRRDQEGNETSRVLYENALKMYRRETESVAKIMLLGDSFSRIYQTDDPTSAGWISHIAYELRQPILSIVSDGGASTLVRETLSRKLAEAIEKRQRSVLDGKKLVIWEFVERDLRFGAEGWKDIVLPSPPRQSDTAEF